MPVDDEIDLALPRPAAPSPTQSHGTVMVALLCGFVGLAFLFWWSIRGVGPFTAEIVSSTVNGSTATVVVEVRNEGTKGGHGKCRVTRLIGRDEQTPHRFLSQRVPGHGSIRETLVFPVADGERPGQVSC